MPASLWMARVGRRTGFMAGALINVVAVLLTVGFFLIAKKGHEQGFAPGADGVFAKDPPSGAQLFLKKQ